jgi:hypothetical protein
MPRRTEVTSSFVASSTAELKAREARAVRRDGNISPAAEAWRKAASDLELAARIPSHPPLAIETSSVTGYEIRWAGTRRRVLWSKTDKDALIVDERTERRHSLVRFGHVADFAAADSRTMPRLHLKRGAPDRKCERLGSAPRKAIVSMMMSGSARLSRTIETSRLFIDLALLKSGAAPAHYGSDFLYHCRQAASVDEATRLAYFRGVLARGETYLEARHLRLIRLRGPAFQLVS